MFRTMMKSKIHRATVTEANLNYMGSITIDQEILSAADILSNEKVQVVNNNNGTRLETYVIPGTPGSGVLCLNGAAARMVQPGDEVIVISYCLLGQEAIAAHKPIILFMDKMNKVCEIKKDTEESGVSC